MSDKQNIFGYGFSLEGRLADQQEVEAGLPARKAGCPLTADLLDAVLGQIAPEAGEALKDHLEHCDYCRGRFEAQQRAVQRFRARESEAPLSTAYSEVVAEFRDRRRRCRRGKAETVRSWLADDGRGRYKHRVVLLLPQGEAGRPLRAILEWYRGRLAQGSEGALGPWKVALCLPSVTEDPQHGNPEAELAPLAGCQVRFDLLPIPPRLPETLETQLYWDPDHKMLVSESDVVSLDDPATLDEVEFVPGRRIQVLEAK